jgi:hypothetical protein
MLHLGNIGPSPTATSPARTEREHNAWNFLLASRKVRPEHSLPLFAPVDKRYTTVTNRKPF